LFEQHFQERSLILLGSCFLKPSPGICNAAATLFILENKQQPNSCTRQRTERFVATFKSTIYNIGSGFILKFKRTLILKTMGLQASKLSLVQKILSLNQESVIDKIDELLEREMIVGYTVDGKPLIKAAYNERIAIAEKQLQNGESISQEDLEKESENW
tara:strand:+ start:44113 stop:44589 length:477 start_codon:yes stop_codon:yes gene_type:complete